MSENAVQPESSRLVSVVVPTLNEEKNVDAVLSKIMSIRVEKEVMVIDGGSSDRTVDACLRYTDKVYRQMSTGKGGAIREGVEKSKGDCIVIVDGDGSHDPSEIPSFLRALFSGADIVRGSRFMDNGHTFDMEPWRRLGNRFLVVLANLLFHSSFSDLCYGYLAFRRKVFFGLETQEKGFAIDTEITVKAKKLGLKIVEVPSVELLRNSGKSRLRAIPDGVRILYVILRVAFSGE